MKLNNSNKFFKNLVKAKENIYLYDDRELLLNIMCVSHAENLNNIHIIGTSSISIIGTIAYNLFPIPSLLAVVFGTVAGFAYVQIKDSQLKALTEIMTQELLSRYPTPKEAYLEVSKLIQSITREELVEYLDKLSK